MHSTEKRDKRAGEIAQRDRHMLCNWEAQVLCQHCLVPDHQGETSEY